MIQGCAGIGVKFYFCNVHSCNFRNVQETRVGAMWLCKVWLLLVGVRLNQSSEKNTMVINMLSMANVFRPTFSCN